MNDCVITIEPPVTPTDQTFVIALNNRVMRISEVTSQERGFVFATEPSSEVDFMESAVSELFDLLDREENDAAPG